MKLLRCKQAVPEELERSRNVWTRIVHESCVSYDYRRNTKLNIILQSAEFNMLCIAQNKKSDRCEYNICYIRIHVQ
jgi:hypothetical protein